MSDALRALLDGLAATSALERVSVGLGLVYSVLAVRRVRWCWVAGAGSSAILVYLFARAHLPMQALLQGYYVAMSVYGFVRWRRQEQAALALVTTWPARVHLAALVLVLLVSMLSSRVLASQTAAAWPFLDSLTTWASLFATLLVVRMKLENWLYWIAIDTVLVFLFAAQKLVFVALMYAVFLIISIVGFATWLKTYRLQSAAR